MVFKYFDSAHIAQQQFKLNSQNCVFWTL